MYVYLLYNMCQMLKSLLMDGWMVRPFHHQSIPRANTKFNSQHKSMNIYEDLVIPKWAKTWNTEHILRFVNTWWAFFGVRACFAIDFRTGKKMFGFRYMLMCMCRCSQYINRLFWINALIVRALYQPHQHMSPHTMENVFEFHSLRTAAATTTTTTGKKW